VTQHATSVLWITGAYFPEFSAGGLQCQAVAREIRGRISVAVLTTATTPTLPAYAEVEGVGVTRVRVEPGGSRSLAASAAMTAALMRLLPRADIVHVQGFSTKNVLVLAMARLFGRPVVIHLQTSRHDEPEHIRPLGRLAWWAFSSADYYLAVSQGLLRCYLDAGLPADRIEELPNGVDVARFRPAVGDERSALRQQLGLPIDRPLILFVGVMSPDKQPQVLLDAWEEAERRRPLQSTVVFVGATDPRLFELKDGLAEQLKQRLVDLGAVDQVRFVPPTPSIELYYRAADVVVMPSIREGLPNVVLEAMASGLPVIASRLPGSTDTMIDDGVNGRLVEPGDRSGFASAIVDVLSDGAAAARMGAAARRTVEERYRIGDIAERWLGAYHRALSRRHHSGRA
jgi:glycosyltransferase involved in cell wall biosynthesis